MASPSVKESDFIVSLAFQQQAHTLFLLRSNIWKYLLFLCQRECKFSVINGKLRRGFFQDAGLFGPRQAKPTGFPDQAGKTEGKFGSQVPWGLSWHHFRERWYAAKQPDQVWQRRRRKHWPRCWSGSWRRNPLLFKWWHCKAQQLQIWMIWLQHYNIKRLLYGDIGPWYRDDSAASIFLV